MNNYKMIEMSNEQLEGMKKNDKYKWTYKTMKRFNSPSMGPSFIPALYDEKFMFECQNCNARFMIEGVAKQSSWCEKCGSTKSFKSGFNDDFGISCSKCRAGFSIWSCLKCGKKNDAALTLYVLEKETSGCFIATAVYDSYDAPEVITLRRFRDNRLLHSTFGKQFVKGYYCLSPPIASWISDKQTLKTLLRNYFFNPLMHLLNKSEKRDFYK
jgi:hypothetical protein